MIEFPRLETDRLVLREILDANAEDLFKVFGHEQHMKWFGSEPMTSLEGAKALVTASAGWSLRSCSRRRGELSSLNLATWTARRVAAFGNNSSFSL